MQFWVDNEKKFKQLINILRDPMDKNKKMEMHTHDFIEIEYVLSGTGTQIINGQKYKVKRGDVIFLKKGDCHTYHTENHIDILNIVFYYSVFNELNTILYTYTSEIDFPTITHIPSKSILRIEELLLNAEKEFLNEEKGYYQILKSSLTTFLIYLWRINSESQNNDNKNLTSVIEYIDDNYINLSIHDIAQYFNYTDNYFSTLFKKSFGISFTEYINKKRVNAAVELLITTNLSIENICHMVGLSDKKHFYDIFKKYIGSTPGELRRKSNK